jgi:hypothetical protein
VNFHGCCVVDFLQQTGSTMDIYHGGLFHTDKEKRYRRRPSFLVFQSRMYLYI